MSAILEVQERIQGTIALIAEYEKAALRPGAPASLSVNIRSLEKSRAELEEHFHEIAAHEEMDVCRYRLLIDQQRPAFGSITKSWNEFQALFSSLYDAVKNGPKKRGRISKHDLAATQFGFAFTFAGSIGVALTLPIDRYADADYVDKTTEVLFEMAKAGTVEEVAGFVERFGVPPIIRLNRWVKAHVEFRSGAAVEWRSKQSTSNLLVQFPELKRLQHAIATVSEPRVEEQVMPGLLVGANTSKHTFQMRLDDGDEISGAFTDAISQEHKVELPKHYQAVIRKTTQIKEATEQEEVSYFLVRLGRPLRP